MRRIFSFFSLVIAASMLAACAGTSGSKRDDGLVQLYNKRVTPAQAADWKATATMGGPLRLAEASYDVAGSNTITVRVTNDSDLFEIPLDSRLAVSEVTVDGKAPLAMQHEDGLVKVALAEPWQQGERHEVTITYAGVPHEALAPPWSDGMVWKTSEDGSPWIGSTSQGSGGDLWWPVKDHPSDEPDEGMRISLDVPQGLVGLANGRKLSERVVGDRAISEWEVSYPINQYGVAIAIGPYVAIPATYTRANGKQEEIIFWALPEHEEQAREMWLDQGPRILAAFEKRFGEYPFWNDKYWVVETPHLGMEHQTLVAYGNDFEINDFGFDWLLLHETAHEWWGNKVSARDWADWWLHEGFGAYAHAVFVDVDSGKERYLEYMQTNCNEKAFKRFSNPIISGTDVVAEAGYVPEVYSKASCALHTLRWLMEDEDFWAAVYQLQNDERFAYKTANLADFRGVVNEIDGEPHDWFFDKYFFTADIPRWSMSRARAADHETIVLEWNDPLFQLPIPVSVNGKMHRIAMRGGKGSLRIPLDAEVKVDPDGWLLALPAEVPTPAR